MIRRVLSVLLVLILGISVLMAGGASEGGAVAGYPRRPITILVGSAAGGGTDIMARSLAEVLDLGVAINIVNRTGASGTVAATELANSKPDGYTLNIGMPAATYIVPHTQEVPYTMDSFRNIAVISPDEQLVICVTPDSPIQDWDDFLALMATDQNVNIGTANPGSVGNIAWNDIMDRIGADENKTIVPFQGASEALTALLGNHIDITIADLLEVTGRISNGTIRAIAVTGDERCGALPDVPCLKELGYDGTAYAVAWKWVQVPKDTPDEIVEYLKEKINEAIVGPEYSKFIKDLNGLDTYTLTEEEINAKIEECNEAFGAIIAQMNAGN